MPDYSYAYVWLAVPWWAEAVTAVLCATLGLLVVWVVIAGEEWRRR